MLAAGLSGAVATAVDVTTLVAEVHAGVPIALAAFVAATAGAVVGFTLGKYVAFRDRRRLTLAQVARFAAVALGTALLMAGAMQLLAVELRVPYLVAKLVCSALVFAAWTYPAQRRIVFHPNRPALSPS